MSWMFRGCSSLTNLPNISKWNIKEVEYMRGMFEGCEKLKNIPDKFREKPSIFR